MIVELPKLEAWQKEVVVDYENNPHSTFFVIKAIRQCGKSILLQVLLVAASLKEKDSVSISVSPVMAQSRKMYEDICRFAEPLIKRMNNTLMTITFINGSKIIFKSGEQGDSIRGETCKNSGILCVDEAAYQDDSLFYNILIPTTNVYRSDIFVVSTPRFKDGFFYHLFTGENSKTKVYDWTTYDTSKYLDKDTLEMYRKELPKNAFLSEFCGEFISGDGQVFNNFKKCIDKLDYDNSPVSIGIDWGSGAGKDYTVLSYGQIRDNKICVIEQKAFNDKTPTETIRYIISEIKRFIACKEINIVVEKNSIGSIYYSNLLEAIDELEDLVDIDINCSCFTTTNSSKKKLVETLEVLFENERIVIPNDNSLLTELSMFEAKVNKDTGNISYAVYVPNKHDDRVMSLLFLITDLIKEV